MNRSRSVCCYLFVISAFFAIAATHPCSAGEQEKNIDFPQVIKLGASGPIVFDLHATLNAKVAGERIDLPQSPTESANGEGSFQMRLAVGEAPDVHVLILPNGREIRVPTDWEGKRVEVDGEGKPKPLTIKAEPITTIQLPAKPIESFGIYGEQTFALVMLFQIKNNLMPTGKVDAVTMRKLAPLVPSRYPILAWLQGKPKRTGDSNPSKTRTVAALKTTFWLFVAGALVYGIARLIAHRVRKTGDRVVARRSRHTRQWHQALCEARVFAKMAHFAPAIFIAIAVLFLFPDYGANDPGKAPALGIMDWDQYRWWHWALAHLGLAYIVLAGALTAWSLVNAFRIAFNLRSHESEAGSGNQSVNQEEETPVSGIVFAAKVIIVGVGLLLFYAAASGKNPLEVIAGLSVFTAFILVVFRDTLLSLVASVQIVANEVVKVGDWIEMPKYGANGDVTAISLNIIKVRNFDKTISTIPTQAVLSESFRNWSSMHEAGGRRIKRALFIDMNSIRICDSKLQKELRGIDSLQGYFDENAAGTNTPRTNIGAFRTYIADYLKSVEQIHDEEGLRYIVRYLQPTPKGLPLEIYAFSNETAWAPFESVQSEIMEHVLAVLPKFSLHVFQDLGDRNNGDSR